MKTNNKTRYWNWIFFEPPMSIKSIFIITVTVLVTVILMKNTDEVSFWIFGDARVPKLAVLGTMFGLGFIIGILAGRPGKKKTPLKEVHDDEDYLPEEKRRTLSDEDRDYIS